MELPSALRQAVDRALSGIALADLTAAAALLSQRYRAEIRDGRFHLADDMAALAYLTTRLPATYAAIRAAMAAAAQLLPDFSPLSLLDVGAGPGSALWAAADTWPGLDDALLIEGSAAIRAQGENLAAASSVARIAWRPGNVPVDLPALFPPDSMRRDLVTLAYVLDELAPAARDLLVEQLWSMTGGLLLIVEPGTPAGWQRILTARGLLIDAGAVLVAPCPHAAPCPLAAPDWCHFSRRVARSRLHRQVKGADVPWEDEKFIYLAAARPAIAQSETKESPSRILAPPRGTGGRIGLKLCTPGGTVENRAFSKRDGDAYKAARRRDWGDVL